MTIEPDNRSEAVDELKKLRTVSISRIPLENSAGPVFEITAPSNNSALTVAGQTGLELGYKYFIVIDSGSNQYISGYVYKGTGGVSTKTVYTITIAYTDDENYEARYNVYECSSLLDGYTFVTQRGKIASWTLFGTSLVGGTVIMFSALSLDYDDPNVYNRLIGGGLLMAGSVLFTIPLW
jgi:hypothetical protein